MIDLKDICIILSQTYLQEWCKSHNRRIEAISEHQRQQSTSWFETWQPFAALYHGIINWNISWKAAWSHDFEDNYCSVSLQTRKETWIKIYNTTSSISAKCSHAMKFQFGTKVPNQHEPVPIRKLWQYTVYGVL